MTPEVHSFTRLLGRVHTDPDVAELMLKIGLSNQRIKLKKGDYSASYSALQHGVDVTFVDPAEHPKIEASLDGALIFDTVFFFSAGCQDHDQYPRSLPLSLAFNLSREKVRKWLSSPEWSSPILPVDRWTWEGLKLAIHFRKDESSIAYLSCGLKK